MSAFPYTAEEIVAVYKKRGVRPKKMTWARDGNCMCPMTVVACDKLAEGDKGWWSAIDEMGRCERENHAHPSDVIGGILGVDAGAVKSFAYAFDTPRPDDKPSKFRVQYPEAAAAGVATRRLIDSLGMMEP